MRFEQETCPVCVFSVVLALVWAFPFRPLSNTLPLSLVVVVVVVSSCQSIALAQVTN